MKTIRCLFLFAWIIIIGVPAPVSAVTPDAVSIQLPSSRGRNPISDSRQNSQLQRNERQRIQQDAVRRLTRFVTEAAQIDDAAARARVLARLADILWKRDEKRSRVLFQMAYDDCRLIPVPSIPGPSESDLTPSLTCGTVRSEIVRSVAARDPEFAHSLAARILQENNCSFGPRNRHTSESAKAVFIMQIAIALVEKNPVAAASLGRQSLQDGIVYSFPELLAKLKTSDTRLADDLTSAAITRIASDSVNALEFVTIGRYLLDSNLSVLQKDKLSEGEKNAEASLAVRFLDSILAATNRFVNSLEQKGEVVRPEHQGFSEAASINEMAASFFAALTEFLPSFERYQPTRLASARALVERLGQWMDPIERAHMFVFYDNGDTPESLVAEAETNTEVKTRDEIYYLAASLADLKGDSDKALSIASKISAPERREDTIDGIWNLQVVKAISEGRYAEAQQLVPKITKSEGRITQTLMIATRASQAGLSTQAISLLDETTAMLLQNFPSPSPEQAEILMEIAQVYIRANVGREFTAMKNAIDAINAAVGKPVNVRVRKRFGRPVIPTDPLSLYGSDLSAFESLARTDYFRSLQLAKSFDDRSLAIVAQLTAMRPVLLDP